MTQQPPLGLADLEGRVAVAAPTTLVMLPAGWLRALIAYVRALEKRAGKVRAA